MPIAAAYQNGDRVEVFDDRGFPVCPIQHIPGQRAELLGYTASTVSIRRGNSIEIYNERGVPISGIALPVPMVSEYRPPTAYADDTVEPDATDSGEDEINEYLRKFALGCLICFTLMGPGMICVAAMLINNNEPAWSALMAWLAALACNTILLSLWFMITRDWKKSFGYHFLLGVAMLLVFFVCHFVWRPYFTTRAAQYYIH